MDNLCLLSVWYNEKLSHSLMFGWKRTKKIIENACNSMNNNTIMWEGISTNDLPTQWF